MTKDKVREALVEALKQALGQPGEQRLFKSGKLTGLFPSRAGANADAATHALRDGLLEMVRTETKGRTVIEWVRITPRGVRFLHDHESPVGVLRELREELRTTKEGVPAWLVQTRQEILALGSRLAADVQRVMQRLDALGQRVEEALRRSEAIGPPLPDGVAATVPWALDALTYLDRRRKGGAADDCPLPELFAALREQHNQLSVTAFHEGLRRLSDRRALRLLPFTEAPDQLPEPEYALLDGAAVLYYAAR
ncbi:MAG TPA: hypothetical protein VKI65_15180 [Gemmataceae bacterium]|nr:hypothetical protein [Gemmataceae bacterium]